MRPTSWCCILFLVACSTPSSEVRSGDDGVQTALDRSDDPRAVGSDAPSPRTREVSLVEASARPQGSNRLADLWAMPDFARRFRDSYLSATEVEPGVTLEELAVLEKAFERIQEDQLDEAERILRREMNESSSAVFDFTLGQIHFQRDELDEAVAAYTRATDGFANFRRAWQALGQIHFAQEAYTKAALALTRVLELGGGNATTYGLLGVAELRLEQFIAAESAFRMANLLAPESMDWKYGLADAFLKQQRYPEAIALFGALIGEQPERAEFWLAQGEAYARIDRPMKAAENFEMVDRLGAASAVTLYNLGDIYSNAEVYDLAVDKYLSALDAAPQDPIDRAVRAAKFIVAKGGYTDGKRLIAGIEDRRGDSLDEEVAKDLLRMRARIAVSEGAGAEEAEILGRIIELDPLDGDALILLGQYHAREGQIEKAVFHYERAAGLEAFEADAKVRHAQLLVGEGKYQDAIPLLKQAQAIEPRDNIQSYLEQVERAARRGS